MPKGAEVQEVIRGFTGQKSAVPSGSLNATDAERILNFTVRKFRLRKIWGASLYANLGFGNPQSGVTWIDRFRQTWFCQRGNSIGKETESDSKIFEEAGTILLGTANRIRSEKWRNRLYMVNGVENKFFEDGNAEDGIYKLGITPPGNNRTTVTDEGFADLLKLTQTAGGSLDGIFQYCFTWYDANRNIESLPHDARIGEDGLWYSPHESTSGPNSGGDPSATFPDFASNQTASFDISHAKELGYDVDRVTHWILYRREIDESTSLPIDDYKRVMTSNSDGALENAPEAIPIDDDTTDDDGSGDLSLVLDDGNSPPPSGQYYIDDNLGYLTGNYGPRFIKRHNDQLWLFGVRFPGRPPLGGAGSFGGYLPASGIAYASDVSNPDYWGEWSYDIGYADDQQDTGMAKYRNTLIFFKTRSIYYLDGTTPDNYTIRELDAKRGAVAAGSIQETPVGIIALSSDGFILVDSVSPAKVISEDIFDEIQKINFAQSEKIISAYNIGEGKYECHVPSGPSLNANKIFVFDINTRSWDIRNKNVGGSAYFDINQVGKQVGLLGDPNSGRVYDLLDESQVTFNGQKISGKWASKHFDFGEPDKQKRLVSMRFRARSYGSFNLDIDVIMDHGQQETYSLKDINSDSIFTNWAETQDDDEDDELVLDEGQLSEEFTWKKFEVLLSGVARNFQIVIRESGTMEASRGFEIDEIVLVGNLLGR